jgi:hypothetical protein
MLNNKYNGYLGDFAKSWYNVSKFSPTNTSTTPQATVQAYDSKKTYKAGDTFTNNGKTYKFDGKNAIQQ